MIPGTITLSVEGMSCDKCAARVKKALLNVPGVEVAEVTLSPGRAVVTYDTAMTPDHALLAAVEGAGYHSTVIA